MYPSRYVYQLRIILPWLLVVLSFQLGLLSAQAGEYLTPEHAKNYLGSTQTVCGNVASTYFAKKSRGKPTFINLNKPYPNHIFMAVIWIEDRGKFSYRPETALKGKNICVSGEIKAYKGTPEIIVRNPFQIKVR